MGCDIHTFVEKRVNGQWLAAEQLEEADEGETHQHLPKTRSFTGGRDYRLFGLLSGVRCDWGMKIIPDADMCIPEDASAEVKAEHAWWDSDAHTEGWVSWQALQDALKAININVLMGKMEPSAKEAIDELTENFTHIAESYHLNVREMRIILWYDN